MKAHEKPARFLKTKEETLKEMEAKVFHSPDEIICGLEQAGYVFENRAGVRKRAKDPYPKIFMSADDTEIEIRTDGYLYYIGYVHTAHREE